MAATAHECGNSRNFIVAGKNRDRSLPKEKKNAGRDKPKKDKMPSNFFASK